ncbi:proteasome subunit alpha type 1, putative [Babesia bigemina]|uniref:Proteasome subunit alpha type 1, putative n=1 Tax=Babesia bigemina TaxID=5866 RepID=A0A061DBG6_BABBI|nr:proteasome subunit alpha type 1, putative [Babesia bigemina]CDR97883.1 proteasome subunit alpha type 1, putative [Babesia bigemina]|eukprot:XP_012770069.1 proteasome subunit alpha type 1, putative [Babesia bigemina]
MYRNQYDTDCITWSPQGRLFQVEYAMEAVKQGSCCVGIKSATHITSKIEIPQVLCAVRRKTSKHADYQDKIFRIADYIAVAMSGITSDAKMIVNFMRNECLNNRYLYGCDITASKLVSLVSRKSQANTQVASKRPFGVGLLVAGYDEKVGLRLYETCPSGNVVEYNAAAFGARCQSAKTYLERKIANFESCNVDSLLYHAVKAVKLTMPHDVEFTSDMVTACVLGQGMPFKLLTAEEIQPYIEKVGSRSVFDTAAVSLPIITLFQVVAGEPQDVTM